MTYQAFLNPSQNNVGFHDKLLFFQFYLPSYADCNRNPHLAKGEVHGSANFTHKKQGRWEH
jgi:hypothetical protein